MQTALLIRQLQEVQDLHTVSALGDAGAGEGRSLWVACFVKAVTMRMRRILAFTDKVKKLDQLARELQAGMRDAASGEKARELWKELKEVAEPVFRAGLPFTLLFRPGVGTIGAQTPIISNRLQRRLDGYHTRKN